MIRTSDRSLWSMLVVAGSFWAGCAAPEVQRSEATAPELSTNGLDSVNGLNSHNGLNSVNGLNSHNGLDSVSGLSATEGLMTTEAGRKTISYLVRCALPQGRAIVKADQYGTSYTFPGQLGLAPEWESGACDLACQEYVSACVMAHVNTTGKHIPIWLVTEKSNIGWGLSPDFPRQEGSFFGNFFVSPPQAFYCEGKDFAVGVVAGRIGSNQVGAPYTNSFTDNQSLCQSPNDVPNCAPADIPNQGSGFKACAGFNHVITVWRQ
ncbi:MAG TPA: hypothetical protein VHU40_08865 [Polyangia bacterium]|nr:hypothetical protein [Polyangia bacterium]